MEARVDQLNRTLFAAVVRILRALVRVMLRHGVPANTFVGLVKRAYVDVALDDFAIPGRKQSISRVALLTGLTRKETQRLAEMPERLDVEDIERHSRAARVVAGWVRDKDFHDRKRAPAPLAFDEGEHSYAELVRRYGGDVPPRAVLDELLRVGAVERLADGRIRLLARVYIPRTSDLDKVAILGTDVSYLIGTIDHNLQSDSGPPRFQRKVEYDNLPREAIAEFRELSGDSAQELIEKLDRWLSRRDRDANPLVRGTGRMRAGIGIYYYEEDLDPENGVRKLIPTDPCGGSRSSLRPRSSLPAARAAELT